MCEYFAGCERYPNGMVANPMLGRVPTCGPCAERMEQTLLPFTFEEALSMVVWLEANDAETFVRLIDMAMDELDNIAELGSDEIREHAAHIIRNDNSEVLA